MTEKFTHEETLQDRKGLEGYLSPEELKHFESLEGIEALDFLNSTGKFVFHGSTIEIDELEPRQPRNKGEDGVFFNDGKPAVCATKIPQIAVFMAVIASIPKDGSNKFTYGYSNSNNQQVEYRITKSVADKLDGHQIGLVHVMDKKNFQHERGDEWRSLTPIKPVTIIEVTNKDLPENIEIT